MKQVLIGAGLVVAGAALGAWLGGQRTAEGAAPDTAPRPVPAAGTAQPQRYALQAWEGCHPLEAGGAFAGPVTRTLALSGGGSVEVSLVPAVRDNGELVFDTLVKGASGSARSQVGFQGVLLAEGVLLRAVDLDAVQREVSGGAAYLDAPHPMAR